MWIAMECPYPPNTGGRIGTWKRIEYLSKENAIYLYTITDKENELLYVNKIKGYCKEVHMYSRNKSILGLFKCIVYPYPAVSRWNKKFKSDIYTFFKTEYPDLIIIDYPQMFGVVPKEVLNKGTIVLNQHNTEYLTLESIARSIINNPIKKLVFNIVAKQMKLYENSIYKRDCIDLYTFVSKDDKNLFDKTYKSKNTLLVPVGTEVLMDKSKIPYSYNIGFIGKMSYSPNIEAIAWFLNNVWDKVKLSCPDVKLYIVGKNPTDYIQNFSKKDGRIIVTGTVESVDEYYDKCSLIIIPLLEGGGVKVKLLEALGKGKIVITTNKGIEGTDFKHGEEVLVANTPREFAQLCADVLNNPDKYEYIVNNALNKVKKDYSWKNIVDNFEKHLKELNDHGKEKTI